MDVILATLVLAGIVLVIGAGLFERWVAPQVLSPGVRRVLWAGLLVGSMMVIVASFGDVAMTATRVLRGRFDLGFMGEYLFLTRHGRGALASVAATLALLGWGLWRVRLRRVDRLVHAALSVGLLTSIAWVSHSGTMGLLPMLGDLGHLMAATTWAGSLAYLAWAPVWRDGALPVMVARISTIGVASVALLVVSGIYMSVLHLYGLEALTSTAYGVSLLVKLALVAVIVGVAGVNRWWLAPLLARGRSRPLLIAVRIEAVLLALVLVATGVLTTREPAHAPVHGHDHASAVVWRAPSSPAARHRSGPILRAARLVPSGAAASSVVLADRFERTTPCSQSSADDVRRARMVQLSASPSPFRPPRRRPCAG